MKTKEVIKLLHKADPSGELECGIDGNIDIHAIYTTPTYYDGYLQILERDHSNNIRRATITGIGTKVKIEMCSIEDAIVDDPDLPVKIIKDPTGYYKKQVEKYRQETKQMYKEIENRRIKKEEK